jgi:BlaR1 peptidase M56
MDSLLFYVIRSVLVSGLLTGYYVLALRGRRMHGFNRFYLLGSVALSLVLPLVRIHWAPWVAGGGTVRRVLAGISPGTSGNDGAFWERLALGACLLVSVVMVVGTVGKIRALYRLKRAASVTPMEGYELVETEAPGTPFSFLRNLFWRSGMDREDTVNGKMLAHELAHIRGRHSWDILGIQAVVCLFWMNPFFWYIRRELNLVLEFAADVAGAEDDPEMLAKMLLQAYAGGRYPTLSHAFFHSPIKRRLVMITNKNGSRRVWMRKALVLPVVAAVVLFFACTKQQPAQIAVDKIVSFKTDTLTMILDDSVQIEHVKYLPSSVKLKVGKNGYLTVGGQIWKDTLMEVTMEPQVPGNLIIIKD